MAPMDAPLLSHAPVQRAESKKLINAPFARTPCALTVERHNMGAWKLAYMSDLFHTLVNLPTYLFFCVFVLMYVAMYCLFAGLYYTQPGCITKTSSFIHLLWFSVHTSATIGYGHMAPNPECTLLNVIIMAQVLTSLVLQAYLVGVVFARFSTPNRRARTIRFSRHMTMHVGADGLNRLSFRVANLRKHQVLRPELRLLLLRRTARRGGGSSSVGGREFAYVDLPWRHSGGQSPLWLGVPTVVTHVVDEGSPLKGMGPVEIERRGWEIVVLLDGTDESTSMPVQARHSYLASDILVEARFHPMLERHPSGFLRADFSSFDLTALAGLGSEAEDGEGSSEGEAAEAAEAIGAMGSGLGGAGSGSGALLGAASGGRGGLGV